MKFFKWVLLVIVIFLTATGCHRHIDDIYLFKHPDLLKKQYLECQFNNLDPTQCRIISQTFMKLTQLVRQLIENPETFGKDVIHLQIKAAQLKKQLEKQPNKKDKKNEYQKINKEIQLRLILMAKAEGL
ncbi:MAG: hypothetical protein JW855_00285 [Gammaproteobacteria bacterium]|nr:hypothetical protein [Gammaproteobacteria bacterium]